MDCLTATLPKCIISRFDDITWPARSPDLLAPDYFLLGHFKAKVNENKQCMVRELKEHVTNEIKATDVCLVYRVKASFKSHLQECTACQEENLCNVIFKK
jgi:hypothetical protein